MTREQIAETRNTEILREGLSDANPEIAARIMEVARGIAIEEIPTTSQNPSNTKFHRLLGRELCAALEATLEVGSGELEFNTELFGGKPNLDLLFRKGDCWRAYFPAVSDGDIQEDDEATIRFVPWFAGPKVLFYRICLRARPLFGNTFRWLKFGRFGEETPFGFSPAKPLIDEEAPLISPPVKPFINLDFFSQSREEFKPLYVKVAGNDRGFIYFVIRAEWSEDGPVLKLAWVNEQDVPPCLQTAKP